MKKTTFIICLTILMFLTLPVAVPSIVNYNNFKEMQSVSKEFNQQVECMAKNLYYEAATESFEGKLAVAQVTMNRTKSVNFPKNVCDVVYQKVNGIYQFSWVGMDVNNNRNKYIWEECVIIARRALTENKLHDIIYNTKAMYYHNDTVNPGWNLKYVTRIGNHKFYAKT